MVEELNRFPLLRRGGAYNVNKKSPQASMQAIKYTVDALGDRNNIIYNSIIDFLSVSFICKTD